LIHKSRAADLSPCAVSRVLRDQPGEALGVKITDADPAVLTLIPCEVPTAAGTFTGSQHGRTSGCAERCGFLGG
jgi:hypothetical protein